MRRTAYLWDRTTMMYFKDTDDGPRAIAQSKTDADLYPPGEVANIGLKTFGPGYQVNRIEVIPATATEYATWMGRRGGKSKSEKKQRAVRLNGSMPKRRFAFAGKEQ